MSDSTGAVLLFVLAAVFVVGTIATGVMLAVRTGGEPHEQPHEQAHK
jgi:hypothetical protein